MAVGAAQVRPSRAAWYWDDRGYAAELLQAATMALHARGVRRFAPYDLLKSVSQSRVSQRLPARVNWR